MNDWRPVWIGRQSVFFAAETVFVGLKIGK
jgi:hypothetical protein